MAAAHLTRPSRRRAQGRGVRSPTWASMAHAHGLPPILGLGFEGEREGGAWATLAHPPWPPPPPPPFLEGGLISPPVSLYKVSLPMQLLHHQKHEIQCTCSTWRPLPCTIRPHLSPFSPMWLPGLELHRSEGFLLHAARRRAAGSLRKVPE